MQACTDSNINEYAGNNKPVIVTPNPANEFLSIENTSNENVDISIVDITGRKILNNTVSAEAKTSINVSLLSNSIYWLMANSNGHISSYKLLIQH